MILVSFLFLLEQNSTCTQNIQSKIEQQRSSQLKFFVFVFLVILLFWVTNQQADQYKTDSKGIEYQWLYFYWHFYNCMAPTKM